MFLWVLIKRSNVSLEMLWGVGYDGLEITEKVQELDDFFLIKDSCVTKYHNVYCQRMF